MLVVPLSLNCWLSVVGEMCHICRLSALETPFLCRPGTIVSCFFFYPASTVILSCHKRSYQSPYANYYGMTYPGELVGKATAPGAASTGVADTKRVHVIVRSAFGYLRIHLLMTLQFNPAQTASTSEYHILLVLSRCLVLWAYF